MLSQLNLFCEQLTEIYIPYNLKNIGERAFAGCLNLKSIHYPQNKFNWESIEKRTNWNSDTGEYTVYCYDGTLEK